ncbi:MAG TPA: carboxypeptidase-like regulatory domain-containing protein [Burkholderiales bacterium]|jgi:hypothetical protein|nr:carboxypeptidase-like regulatory domain-containing protein [Burkholderiales bacterium]
MAQVYRTSGSVLAADGTPLAGAYVTIKDASVQVPEIAVQTDANGRFELRLPQGTFLLRAYAGDRIIDAHITNSGEDGVDIVMRGAD